MVSQLKVNEIIKQSGSSITRGEAGDTVSGPFTNTPAFKAILSSNQVISHNTTTTVQFNNAILDTSSSYDTSNYKYVVPSGQGGFYYIFCLLSYGNFKDLATKRFQTLLQVNDVTTLFAGDLSTAVDAASDPTIYTGGILQLSAGDELRVRTYHNAGVDEEVTSDLGGQFGGYRLIGA